MKVNQLKKNSVRKAINSTYFIFIVISIIIAGCSVGERHKALTFFFDGVPDLIDYDLLAHNDSIALADSIANANISGKEQSNINLPTFHPPYVARECTKCHDHQKGGFQQPQPDLCYQCHQPFNELYASLHAPVGAGFCTECHDPHQSNNGKLLKEKGRDLCFKCHDKPRVLAVGFHKAIGEKKCTECHDPHGSKNAGNTASIKPGLCSSCHEGIVKGFSYKHGPVNAGECAACHGSHNMSTPKKLLREGNNTCFYCHQSTDVLKNDVHRAASGQECIKCHNPHASENRLLLKDNTTGSIENFKEVKGILTKLSADMNQLELELENQVTKKRQADDSLYIAYEHQLKGLKEFKHIVMHKSIKLQTTISDLQIANIKRDQQSIVVHKAKVIEETKDIKDLNTKYKGLKKSIIEELAAINPEEIIPYNELGEISKTVEDDSAKLIQLASLIEGTIKADEQLMANKLVVLLDDKQNFIDSVRSDTNGRFYFRLLPYSKFYLFVLSKSDTNNHVTLVYQDADGKILKEVNTDDNKDRFIYRDLESVSQFPVLLTETDVMIEGSMKKMGLLASGTLIVLKDEQGNLIDSTRSDNNGHFYFKRLPYSKFYLFVLAKADTNTHVNLAYVDAQGKILKEVNTEDNKDRFIYRDLESVSQFPVLLTETDVMIEGSMKKMGLLASGTLIVLKDKQGNLIDSTRSDNNGHFYFKRLPYSKFYLFVLAKADINTHITLAYVDAQGKILKEVNTDDNKDRFIYRDLESVSQPPVLLTETDVVITGTTRKDLQLMAQTLVVLEDENDNVIDSTRSDTNGRFVFKQLPNDVLYLFVLDKSDTSMQVALQYTGLDGKVIETINSTDHKNRFLYKDLAPFNPTLGLLEPTKIMIIGSMKNGEKVAANSPVILVDGKGDVVSTTTSDANGRFSFSQLASDKNLLFVQNSTDPNMRITLEYQDTKGNVLKEVNSDDNKSWFKQQNLIASEISSKLLAKTKMISGTAMNAKQIAPNTLVLLTDKMGNLIDSTRSDAKGHFYFRELPSDNNFLFKLADNDPSLKVTLAYQDIEGNTLQEVNSDDNKNFFKQENLNTSQEIPPLLEKSDIIISGTTMKKEKILPNMPVILVDENGQRIDSTNSDANGHFYFRELPNDRGLLFVLLDNDYPDLCVELEYKDAEGEIIKAVNSTDDKDWFLKEAYKSPKLAPELIKKIDMISGTIMEKGEVIANTLIVVLDEKNNVIDSTRTDDKGRFYFTLLPFEKAHLFVLNQPDSSTIVALDIKDAEGIVLKSVNSSDDKEWFLHKSINEVKKLPVLHAQNTTLKEEILLYNTETEVKQLANTNKQIEESKENLGKVMDDLNSFESKVVELANNKTIDFEKGGATITRIQENIKVQKTTLNRISNKIEKIASNKYNTEYTTNQEKRIAITKLENEMGMVKADIKKSLADLTTSVKELTLISEDSLENYIADNNINASTELAKDYVLKNILFDFGKTTLNPYAYPVLNNLLMILKEFPNPRIEISGHTDAFRDVEKTKKLFETNGLVYTKAAHNKRSSSYNLRLSQQRAEAVINYLVSKGANKKWFVAVGYGESKPIALNTYPDGSDNVKGRNLNRRVEFKIITKNKIGLKK